MTITESGMNLIKCTSGQTCFLDGLRGAPLAPVVRKPTNANPILKVNQGVYFSSPRCCSTLIFGKTLH